MGTRGRWGITRDNEGELADLWEWPWYWRFPAGLVIAAVSIWAGFLVLESTRPEWQAWTLAGIGLFFALVVMYELGCLVLVLVFFGGIYVGIDMLFPNLNPEWSWERVAVVVAIVYAFYSVGRADDKAAKAQREVDALRNRLGFTADGNMATIERLNARTYYLEQRVAALEKDPVDPFEWLDDN